MLLDDGAVSFHHQFRYSDVRYAQCEPPETVKIRRSLCARQSQAVLQHNMQVSTVPARVQLAKCDMQLLVHCAGQQHVQYGRENSVCGVYSAFPEAAHSVGLVCCLL